MTTIITRAGKGSPLTNTEMDTNLTNLNTDKYESGSNASFGTLGCTGNATLGDAEATDTHAIKGATTLLANSASAALQVTQTGSGYSLLVNDESPDTTFVCVDSAGSVGIGGEPGYKLDIYGGAARSSLGAVGVPSDGTYYVGSSADYYLYGGPSAGQIILASGGEARLRIASDGATNVSANSTSAALTVTQTGSGNAFVVEDSASTDSTPFVIDGDGKGVFGSSTIPTYFSTAGVHVVGRDTFNNVSFGRVTDNASPSNLMFQKARGTFASPSIVQSGDSLGLLSARGYDGSTSPVAAQISFEVDGTPGTNDMPGRLMFFTTADGASSPTTALTINSSQSVIPAKLLDLSTSTAGQIKFPATQNASADANTLDDYEEGTWTPTIAGSSSAGTGTYSAQAGSYTKIGRKVSVHLRVIWTAHTGTGNLLITGLPFSAASGVGTQVGSIIPTSLSLTAGNVAVLYAQGGAAQLNVEQYPTGGGSVTSVALDTAATIDASITYFV